MSCRRAACILCLGQLQGYMKVLLGIHHDSISGFIFPPDQRHLPIQSLALSTVGTDKRSGSALEVDSASTAAPSSILVLDPPQKLGFTVVVARSWCSRSAAGAAFSRSVPSNCHIHGHEGHSHLAQEKDVVDSIYWLAHSFRLQNCIDHSEQRLDLHEPSSRPCLSPCGQLVELWQLHAQCQPALHCEIDNINLPVCNHSRFLRVTFDSKLYLSFCAVVFEVVAVNTRWP